MRRRLRWLRLWTLWVLRSNYLLAVSVVAVTLAGAAGLGAFDPNDDRRASPPPRAQATPLPVSTVDVSLGGPFLTVTYVLVATEEERAVWDNVETTINQRELLSRMALEVLVVTNEDQEAAAYELIESFRASYPWNEYVVQDERAQ